jgi:hypothetical protein
MAQDTAKPAPAAARRHSEPTAAAAAAAAYCGGEVEAGDGSDDAPATQRDLLEMLRIMRLVCVCVRARVRASNHACVYVRACVCVRACLYVSKLK